jgi:glycerophosphoryl diester phosphodiesterase
MFRSAGKWRRPLIIAHRGACGILPEQTLEAFELAVEQRADAIELDVIPTRDGVLLARHESELSVTTNIGDLPQFRSRRAARAIDGHAVEGWFSEDFTAGEIRTLRARQRFGFRDHSFDDRFAVPTLEDVLRWRASKPRPVGVFIEIKHPTYFAGIGFDVCDILLQSLSSCGVMTRDCGVSLMCFETRVLKELRSRMELPLIQLLDARDTRPFDWTAQGDRRTYADLLTPEGLSRIKCYAHGIGPWKRLIVPASSPAGGGPESNGPRLAAPTTLIPDAHAAGLFVSAWTFRDEPRFLAADYAGDPRRECAQFVDLGLDAIITDFPSTAAAVRSRQAGKV